MQTFGDLYLRNWQDDQQAVRLGEQMQDKTRLAEIEKGKNETTFMESSLDTA